MRTNQKGFSQVLIILSALFIVAIGATSVMVMHKKIQKSMPSVTESATVIDSDGVARDDQRKEDAATLAVNLYSATSVHKVIPSADQSGLDSFAQPKGAKLITDPLTKKQYIYNQNQQTMKPGEATFGLGVSCDNKIAGSRGAGLIIQGPRSSVAVAIKLEGDGFACESTL